MSIRSLAIVAVIFSSARSRETFDINSLLDNSLPIPDPAAIFATPDRDLSDAELNFTQLAAKYGHPAAEHLVSTEDGYVLKTFHLPGKRDGLPVLLFHGICDSSDTWIVRGNKSLAIALASAGYDVWLGNVRGNKHSQGHLSRVSDESYWNFTFHEHGFYDLAATIDLVLNETRKSELVGIGHSQGTTIYFVLLSTRPEYNEKVNTVIALAPVAYLQNTPKPLLHLINWSPVIYKWLHRFHKYQLFGDNSFELSAIRTLCSTPTTAFLFCLHCLVYPISGYDSGEIDPAFSLVVFKHFLTATSTKNVLHFAQVGIRKSFARFDHGREGNLAAYGSAEPPEYELGNVKSKVVLLSAENDFFSMQSDLAILRERLPSVVKFVVNSKSNMNHIDYVWGENMDTYLFPHIFDSLKQL